MEHNTLKIVDYSDGAKPIEELFLNGKKIDYIRDYSINKKADGLSTLTLVIDCKEVAIIKDDINEKVKEINIENHYIFKKGMN